MKEIDGMVKESTKWKYHPLGELRASENAAYRHPEDGYEYNTFQCTISPRLIEESLMMAWIIRAANIHFVPEKHHRSIRFRKLTGHFDGYEIWTNFSNKGDSNPRHDHGGWLSGVIYHTNHGHPTYFNDLDVEYEGKDGTMIMFPSNTVHSCKEQTEDKERITLAFNLIIDENFDG
tara:strand:+ start:282 stop:809 length:528 start_codon:yes stop_codon:yes gene_type:complete